MPYVLDERMALCWTSMEPCEYTIAISSELCQLASRGPVRLQDEPLAGSWNDLFGVIRDQNSLPAQMRELFVRIFERPMRRRENRHTAARSFAREP